MKPTSIIFIIISVLLIVGGIITCSVAKDIAVTDGYTLFSDTEGGGSYVRHDFLSSSVTKIALTVTDAEINIYGGAEASYIEFFNFRDGLYTLSATGNSITLDEIPNLTSLLSFQGGFSFSGMRYFLRFGNMETGPKRVNVYIGADSAMKNITVSGENCTVYADKLGVHCDIQITAEESATLTGKDLRTTGSLILDAPVVSARMEGCSLNELTLRASKAEAALDRFYCANLYAEMNSGSLSALIPADASHYSYDISGGKAHCRLNGEALTLPYKPQAADSTPIGEIVIQAGNATVDLTISE